MYAKCKMCERTWNISILQKIPRHGYICPWCENSMKESMKNTISAKKRAKIKKILRFLKKTMIYIVPTAISLLLFHYISHMLYVVRGSAELGSELIVLPLIWIWVYALEKFAIGDTY